MSKLDNDGPIPRITTVVPPLPFPPTIKPAIITLSPVPTKPRVLMFARSEFELAERS